MGLEKNKPALRKSRLYRHGSVKRATLPD